MRAKFSVLRASWPVAVLATVFVAAAAAIGVERLGGDVVVAFVVVVVLVCAVAVVPVGVVVPGGSFARIVPHKN